MFHTTMLIMPIYHWLRHMKRLPIWVSLSKTVKRHKFSDNSKWFNKDVKSATNKKHKLHCHLRLSPGNEDIRVEYRIICQRVKALVKQSIIKFESELVSRCKENPKLLYNYINEQRSCRNTIRSLRDKNRVSKSSGIDIVNILNEQFSNVFNPQQHVP